MLSDVLTEVWTDWCVALMLNLWLGLCWSSISVASCSDALFLPYICFSVHSAHALQLLDARRTKVCPYVCNTRCVHNIESPLVCCAVSDTWQFLCTITTSFPMNLQKEVTFFQQCLLFLWIILICSPINTVKLWRVICLFNCVKPNVSGVPPVVPQTLQPQAARKVGFYFSVRICFL